MTAKTPENTADKTAKAPKGAAKPGGKAPGITANMTAKGPGRPRKYTRKTLAAAIDGYFRSISRTVPAEDDKGDAICNDDGDVIFVRQYVTPPSVSGLCLCLGIDRSTWQNYADPALHPELRDVTMEAKGRIEAYLEEQLLTREKSVQGIIFNLQNNYGWRDKQEVELGGETRRTMAEENISIRDKLALISEVQALRAGHGDDDEEGDSP